MRGLIIAGAIVLGPALVVACVDGLATGPVVEDFNTALVTGESRGDTGLERRLFCGAGSIGSADSKDYASFMRFAFRSSLKAAYTTKNLGFRCADDADAPSVTENGDR